MRHFALYDLVTLEVISIQSQPDIKDPPENSVEVLEESLPIKESYIVDGVVTPKQNYTLESLPLPCQVTIEHVVYDVTEQPTFTFNYPGVYKVLVNAGPHYLEKEFEIDYQS